MAGKFKAVSIMISDYDQYEKVRLQQERISKVPVSMPQVIKLAMAELGDKLGIK